MSAVRKPSSAPSFAVAATQTSYASPQTKIASIDSERKTSSSSVLKLTFIFHIAADAKIALSSGIGSKKINHNGYLAFKIFLLLHHAYSKLLEDVGRHFVFFFSLAFCAI